MWRPGDAGSRRVGRAAQRRGLGPHDFSLRRIDVAGELLSQAVAAGAHSTFGVRPSDTFAMLPSTRQDAALARPVALP